MAQSYSPRHMPALCPMLATLHLGDMSAFGCEGAAAGAVDESRVKYYDFMTSPDLCGTEFIGDSWRVRRELVARLWDGDSHLEPLDLVPVAQQLLGCQQLPPLGRRPDVRCRSWGCTALFVELAQHPSNLLRATSGHGCGLLTSVRWGLPHESRDGAEGGAVRLRALRREKRTDSSESTTGTSFPTATTSA